MKNSTFAMCFLAVAGWFVTAQAGTITFNIDKTGSLAGATSDPYVKAKVEEIPNFLQFTFDVTTATSMLADLRGVFFNVSNNSLIGTFSLANATAYGQSGNVIGGVQFELCQSTTGLDDCGSSSNNLQGVRVSFAVAVESGTPGIGTDDIDKIVFDLVSNAAGPSNPLTLNLVANEVFGARLTSVGAAGSRQDSLKLVTTSPPYTPPDTPPDQVPEPETLTLIGIGLLAARWARRCVSKAG